MTTPCPNGGVPNTSFPAVTVPLKAVDNPLPPDVLCGRGGAAQRHAGNLHYRTLVNSNKSYYCTCPKPEKLRISRSIVATVRRSNGRFLERALDGLYYDIGDKKAVEKTSQALREGQPKLRRRIQELQEEGGAAGLPGATVVDGIVESRPDGPCSAAGLGDLEASVRAAAAGYRSPLLGEGGVAAAVFVPEGDHVGATAPAGMDVNGAAATPRGHGHGHGQAVSAKQAYGTLPGRAAPGGTGIAGNTNSSHAMARAMDQARYHPESVQRTPSGTPYLMVGGTGGIACNAGSDVMGRASDMATGGAGGTTEGGGMELSKESIRNLQAEAATGAYGAVPSSSSASTAMQQQQQQVQMQLYQQQLELKRRQEELREQQRRYEEKERARMMGRYQLGVVDLEPTPMENLAATTGGTAVDGGTGGSGLHIDIGASPTGGGGGGSGSGSADGGGMFADISPIALPNQYHHERDVTLRTGNHGGNGTADGGEGGGNVGGERPSLGGFRPPSFKTRSIAEEIQYQQEELRRMQEEAQAQQLQLQLQQEQQRYYQQAQHQAQLAGQQQNQPGQAQQASNNTLSQISLMSTFSAIGDSAMSLGMLVSDREVGDASAGAQATGSPAALAAAARAQAPQRSVVQQASPAIAAMASAAVQPMTAETVSHVHPDPNAGPVSIWDAGESNRDLATLVADNTSIPKEKIMGYMADDHPEQPESAPTASGTDYHEPLQPEALQPERKGRRQIRRNSSVESRRQIFASMKRPVEQPRRPSTVEAESGNTMSSVSSETIGSKQKTASAKASSDSGSDVWRSAEIKASVMAAAAAAGESSAAAGAISESKTSVMSADMDERSNADVSKASGLSMMSMISDLGSQFSLLDFEMDRSTAAGLVSSAQVGQALASAGFGGQQQQPTNQQSPSQQNQEEMEASQYLVSVSEGLMDSSPDRTGRKSSIKEEDGEDEDYDGVS